MNIYGTPGSGGNTYGGSTYSLGFRFTSSQSGTVSQIKYYIPPSSAAWANVDVAIYRDSDQVQISTTQSHTPSGTGAQTCTLTDAVAISASTSYSVAIHFVSDTGRLFWETSQSHPVNNSPLSATTVAYAANSTLTYPDQTDNSVWDGVDIEFTADGGGGPSYVPFSTPYNKLIKVI